MLNWLIILLLDQEAHDSTALGPGGTRGGKWTLLSSQSALFILFLPENLLSLQTQKNILQKLSLSKRKKELLKPLKSFLNEFLFKGSGTCTSKCDGLVDILTDVLFGHACE